MSDYLFKSARLGFRNWKNCDIPQMTSISSDEDVMEFFPDLATPEQTFEFIQRMKNQFDEKSFCYFAVDDLETEEFIGFIGLSEQEYDIEFQPCIDIGWRLAKRFWGKGYATEGAQACMDYALNVLKLEVIVATAPLVNVNSIHVMEKIGMKHYQTYVHPKLTHIEHLKDCVYYVSKS